MNINYVVYHISSALFGSRILAYTATAEFLINFDRLFSDNYVADFKGNDLYTSNQDRQSKIGKHWRKAELVVSGHLQDRV